MRVKHLIRELQKCDPEWKVVTEGCDCIGDTFSLALDQSRPDDVIVEISRSDRYVKYPDEYDNGSDTPDPIPLRCPCSK